MNDEAALRSDDPLSTQLANTNWKKVLIRNSFGCRNNIINDRNQKRRTGKQQNSDDSEHLKIAGSTRGEL